MVAPITSLAEFKQEVGSAEYTIVDFWATWCGPCRFISPIFEKLESQYPNVRFRKVDVDDQQAVSELVGIRAMPTFVLFKDGEAVEQLVGADPKGLQALIQKAAA